MEVDGEAAYRAIKSKYLKLLQVIARGDIVYNLFAEGLIDEEILDVASKKTLTDRDKGSQIVRQLLNSVKIQPSNFEKIIKILQEEPIARETATLLKETYDKIKQEEALKKSEKKSGLHSEVFIRLKEALQIYNISLTKEYSDEESIHKIIKASVTDSIETALKSNEDIESVRSQILFLCDVSFDIPPRLRNWAVEEVAETRKRMFKEEEKITHLNAPANPVAEKFLLNKDILYHASLCCQAVSTCTTANYQKFLNENGHTFYEVSMSISQTRKNVDRYIIAKKDNVVYMAFRSEPSLLEWIGETGGMEITFEEGLLKQMRRIPVRYIEELIGNSNKIIFTGFSFGGMLACCIAARLWKETYINADILEKNIMCVTFGQPLVAIPYVQEAINELKKFENIFHSIYDQEDVFPKLFRYYKPGSVHHRRVAPTTALKAITGGEDTFPMQSVISAESSQFNMLLKSSISSIDFLRSIGNLQEQSYSTSVSNQESLSSALEDIKEVLHNVISRVEADTSFLYGQCYLISLEENKGLQWNSISKTTIEQLLRLISIDKLETSFVRKHIMKEYCMKIFRSHLEKDLQYIKPGPVIEVPEVSTLKPEVTSVAVYKYPDEHQIVLGGKNLWFCHEVSVGEDDTKISKDQLDEAVTGRSIHFNYEATEKSDHLVRRNGKMKVTICSHFANPIRKNVLVEQEPCTFSLRQIQLAKQTPCEVIMLAFWCAMLEQFSHKWSESDPSKRFQAITHFLEEAVKVVPIESIFFAIGYDENINTAVECARALIHAKPSIPSSYVAIQGARMAAVRMRTGIYCDRYLNQIIKTLQSQGISGFSLDWSAPNSDELMFTVNVPTYAIRFQSFAEVVGNRPEIVPAEAVDNIIFSLEEIPNRSTFPLIADGLDNFNNNVIFQQKQSSRMPVLCNMSIEQLYPVQSIRRHVMKDSTLKSPLKVLQDARKELTQLLDDLNNDDVSDLSARDTSSSNEQMLTIIKEINDHNLKICTSLLGGFMEQQIQIPMIKSEVDTATLLSEKSSPVAMGAWALFSLNFEDLQEMLKKMDGNPLLLEIADYMSEIADKRPGNHKKRSSRYAAKLQFLLQGMRQRTISCSSQYISYSLEHQLCKDLKFKKDVSVNSLVKDWDKTFEGDALSLVARDFRPLVARWLKWVVLVHNLRESLARYTCVGVTGLINSGKSRLVSKLFDIQIKVGTANRKRTTVPFLYNMDGKVTGLDVIDFPGVDDKDHTVPELANLLLSLAQIIVFVVDYRRISSDTAKEWIKILKERDAPVIVCLTHADRFYVECMEEDDNKNSPELLENRKRKIGMELQAKKDDIAVDHPSIHTDFYCFHLPADTASIFSHNDLKKVGIGSPWDVGDQLVEIFESKVKQQELAISLKRFLKTQRDKFIM